MADAATPRYFALDGVAVDVARRFVRSPQGRRMTDTLLRGGPRVHTPEAPRITDWALRAARSALEAVPAGKRSAKANELLAACTCPAATGPNPGRDGGSHYDHVESALDRD